MSLSRINMGNMAQSDIFMSPKLSFCRKNNKDIYLHNI